MDFFWSNLPFWRRISRIFLIFFISISAGLLIVVLPAFITSLFAGKSFDDFDRLALGIATAVCLFVFVFCLLWWKVEIREWKIKYFIPGKAFREAFEELLTHFGAYPEEAKLLRKCCRENYRKCGKLFDYRVKNDWRCREKQGVKYSLMLANALNACCQSRGGFEEFISLCDKEMFVEYDRAEKDQTPMAPYTVYNRLSGAGFPDGLSYLFGRVFALCQFSLYDNGMSEEFTKTNEQAKSKLKEVYSPILFSYESAIQNAIARLEVLAQKEADKSNS